MTDENTLIEKTGKRKCMVCDRQYKQIRKAEARDLTASQLAVLKAAAANVQCEVLRPAARGQIESSLETRRLLVRGPKLRLTALGREVLERETAERELTEWARSQPEADWAFEDLAEFSPCRAEDTRERALTRMESERDSNETYFDRYAGTVWE